MSEKWLVVPYGNAVADGKPESEWDWMVNRDDDSESIEVESKERAEEIAALMNLPWRAGLTEAAKVAHDERARRRALEEALRGLREPYEATWTDDLSDLDPRIQTLLNAVRVAYDLCANTAFRRTDGEEVSKE